MISVIRYGPNNIVYEDTAYDTRINYIVKGQKYITQSDNNSKCQHTFLGHLNRVTCLTVRTSFGE